MLRFVVLFLLFIPLSTPAQRPDYPQGYFRNPLDLPMLLAGNFGECRPGHFHSGLDIKTGGKENAPVRAAADGYVSRVKMEPGGFGHGLYVTHPNGYTTLYAHLNDFGPAVQKYVRQQQYARESWTLDLTLTPNMFPVKKGEQIAWSGNTGGSSAPHLHFEIRNTKTEHPLNPQLFGFEVKDTRAPVLSEIVIYKTHSGGFIRYPLKKQGSAFPIDTLLVEDDILGIGVAANDFMDESDNTLAFYTAEWSLDGIVQGRIKLNNIGYEHSRYVNAYADYSIHQKSGIWVQRLFRLKGNKLGDIYEDLNQSNGLISLPDDHQYHRIEIVFKDVQGNQSTISLVLLLNQSDYLQRNEGFAKAGRMHSVVRDNILFRLDESVLYEDVDMNVDVLADSAAISPRFMVGRSHIPVHKYFDLCLKPNKLLSFALRSKVAMIYTDGKDESGRKASPADQGWYIASVRALGEYRLVIDTTAPSMKPVSPINASLGKAKSIAFKVTDNFTSVKSFRGELDGKWLLFEQHGNVWTHVFDEHCPKGKHVLTIKAADENGNVANATYNFTR